MSRNEAIWEQGYQDGRDARDYVNVFASGTSEAGNYESGFLAGKLARAIAFNADQLPEDVARRAERAAILAA